MVLLSNIIDITTYILKGGIFTLKLFIVTFIISLPLGLICSLGKVSKYKLLKLFLGFYSWIFRGTPLLLQLFFTYFGLPILGIKLTPFYAASITFVLNYTAYFIEIFRSGIASIDNGQSEAAKALGMNYGQTMKNIIIPQAIKRVLPPLCNEGITLIKDTALVAAIGMQDLLRAAKEIVTRDFTTTPFLIAALIYLLLSFFILNFFRSIEKKLSYF